MLFVSLLCIVGVVTSTKESKFYCHFYQELQSVCLQKVDDELRSVSKNTIHAVEDKPEEPLYTSTTWPTQSTFAVRAGILTIPEDAQLPWPTGYYASFMKTITRDGASYYDITFEDNDVERFTKLIPISTETIDSGGQLNKILGTFKSDLPHSMVATVEKTEKGDISVTIKYTMNPALTVQLTKVRSIQHGRVMVMKKGQIEAKAFFFRLPTRTVQYGIMVHTASNCYILYKTDQIGLRNHDKLSPGYIINRDTGEFVDLIQLGES